MNEEQKKRVEEISREGIGGKDGLHAWRNEKWLIVRVREQEKEIEQLDETWRGNHRRQLHRAEKAEAGMERLREELLEAEKEIHERAMGENKEWERAEKIKDELIQARQRIRELEEEQSTAWKAGYEAGVRAMRDVAKIGCCEGVWDKDFIYQLMQAMKKRLDIEADKLLTKGEEK